MASIISAGTTSGTSLNLSGDTSGVLQLATNGSTTAITVDTSQNVGIGTASPGQRLDVQGASGDVRIRIKSNGGGGGGIFVADGDGAGSFPGYQTAQSGTNYWTIGQRGDTNLYMNREAGSGRVIVPTGSFQVATTIGVGGATPSTSGAGITFPATQSASSNANTLDDYEEGTWTPSYVSIGGTNPTITYNSRSGYYTKIGNTVNFQLFIYNTAASGGTSTLGITLPFTTSSASSSFAVSYCGFSSSLTTAVKTGYTDPGQANMFLQDFNASAGNVQCSNLAAGGGTLMLAGTYFVS